MNTRCERDARIYVESLRRRIRRIRGDVSHVWRRLTNISAILCPGQAMYTTLPAMRETVSWHIHFRICQLFLTLVAQCEILWSVYSCSKNEKLRETNQPANRGQQRSTQFVQKVSHITQLTPFMRIPREWIIRLSGCIAYSPSRFDPFYFTGTKSSFKWIHCK